MRYMLDTNICIYIMKRRPPEVHARLRGVPVGEVGLSAVVLAELRYGVRRSSQRERSEAALERFLAFARVCDWPEEAAEHYGDIRAELERVGTPIGANDLLIAAHARAIGAVLVTNNGREFERVSGLQVENWVAAH
ncbi:MULTISPECIES: type II toxin-antitoxin system VapC family toxin [unclassified Thioalkalivibrio]|uniref:type II toxin-antitoxin system tRNA(fMet)-specific endonuclease VapC n=1 Tax=unclassified Thioalkalivibrio TaxID=2621013 RepID=UPI000374E52A|nr:MULTISPECIES: type II toxin-antitoxin system VapC family toxin [unclassified Thioalkalivibrio]